ncbi:MAG: amino acid permease, partial [Lentisphaerota bacterium]
IALLKKNRVEGRTSVSDSLIVLLSSIFIVSAFVSASLDEMWLVVVLVMVVMGGYALLLAGKEKAT